MTLWNTVGVLFLLIFMALVHAPDTKSTAETGDPRHHPCGQLHFPRRGGDIRGPRPQRCDPPRQAVYESPRPARPLPPRSAAPKCQAQDTNFSEIFVKILDHQKFDNLGFKPQ